MNEHSLFLIDEPETFLHPPQARVLGKNIVRLSEGKQLFISTHNIDFIRGVLEEASSRVKIIKIDRYDNNNTFNLVNNDKQFLENFEREMNSQVKTQERIKTEINEAFDADIYVSKSSRADKNNIKRY